MADNNTIARPYAQAVFELASEAGELDKWSAALEAAAQLLESGEVVAYLGDPDFSDEQRLDFLTGLFAAAGIDLLSGRDKKGGNFLKLLLEYDRVAVLPEISAHFERLKAEVENMIDVTVTSAAPISKSQQDSIATAMRKRLGRDVTITTEVNENLIGGAVIRAGDVVIDGSMRARLESLATALTK